MTNEANRAVARRAVFLDRDGTLIVNRPYLCDPAYVELLPGVRAALQELLRRGFKLFLLTNQSGIGRGLFSLREAEACNRRMFELLDLPYGVFVDVCIAPERPEDQPIYRKPSPRFIIEMVAKHDLYRGSSWMVGDKISDVLAGLNAGIQAALLGFTDNADLPACVLRCREISDFVERLTQMEEITQTRLKLPGPLPLRLRF